MRRAQKKALEVGEIEWKRKVVEQPQSLPKELLEIISQLYQAFTNEFTDHLWFPEAWSMEQVIEALGKLHGETS